MTKIYFKILSKRIALLISVITYWIVSLFLLIPLIFGLNFYPIAKGLYNFKKKMIELKLMELNYELNIKRAQNLVKFMK